MARALVFSVFVLFLCGTIAPQSGERTDDHATKLDQLLSAGKLSESETHFAEFLANTPDDSQARLALGVTQFLQAIQFLGQTNHRFGLMNQHARNLPLARMPIPLNEKPETVSYDALRTAIGDFSAKLKTAEATLAEVKTASVELPLYVGRIQLDLDADGKLSDEETLWQIFQAIGRPVERAEGEAFYIGVDGADVHWLRGYCHFLMAFCDVLLAYDERELFERCAHLIFPKVDSPYQLASQAVEAGDFDMAMIFDSIAAIHLVQFKLVDKDRMISAHQHLLAVIEQSRQCWERAQNEMDDNNEWIPNDRQTSVLGLPVSREIVTAWTDVLDESQAVLEGEKLIPYWRKYLGGIFQEPEFPSEGTGINLRKFFHEPSDFDLVLTLQGSNVEPYLEEGKLSTPEVWDELTRGFGGRFFTFAIWFN